MVLESIDEFSRDNAFKREALPMVQRLLDQAVLFTFPDNPGDLAEHCAFAIDLYERGLFTLPFPVTAVAFERDLGPPEGKRGGMFVLSLDKEGRVNAISCSETADRGLAIPVGIALRVEVESDGPRGGLIRNDLTAALVNDRIAAAMFGEGDAGRERMRDRLLNNTVNAMALTVMLMSKGVQTEHIETPEKLNKAREKRGKPLIRDRYVVRVGLGSTRVIQHDDGSVSDITGHVRGSPRMHWRRGHFRTIQRGSEGERIVPVAPALIGANEYADNVRVKNYEVRP